MSLFLLCLALCRYVNVKLTKLSAKKFCVSLFSLYLSLFNMPLHPQASPALCQLCFPKKGFSKSRIHLVGPNEMNCLANDSTIPVAHVTSDLHLLKIAAA